MKKRIALIVCCSMLLALAGCGAKSETATGFNKEPIPGAESVQDTAGQGTATEEGTAKEEGTASEAPSAGNASDASITEGQALEAVKNYCYANNPDLEGMMDSEDYTVYFDVSTNESGEIVVLYRSYTAAEIRYYVDPASGDVYVTELVPGIIDEEQRTDETFNIRDYMNGSGKSSGSATTATDSKAARLNGERFESVIMLEGMEETVKYEHAVNEEIGIEMDFDYESLERHSDSNIEKFVSIYDNADDPWNYLEVEYRSESTDSVVASVSEELSKEYEISIDTAFALENAGNCTRIDASADVGGATMPDQLQMVYIIPANGGTVVATAHYSIEAAEGFGHLFNYMMHTLSVI